MRLSRYVLKFWLSLLYPLLGPQKRPYQSEGLCKGGGIAFYWGVFRLSRYEYTCCKRQTFLDRWAENSQRLAKRSPNVSYNHVSANPLWTMFPSLDMRGVSNVCLLQRHRGVIPRDWIANRKRVCHTKHTRSSGPTFCTDVHSASGLRARRLHNCNRWRFVESQTQSQGIFAVRSNFGHSSLQNASQPQPYRSAK